MAKKGSLNLLYLVGMVLTAVGFCCPMFFTKFAGKIKAGSTTGFNFINFDQNTVISIAAILIFAGALLGVALCFLNVKKGKLLKTIALIVSVVGGVILVLQFNDSKVGQFVGKQFLKHAFVGVYMIVAGWVVSLIGLLGK